MSRASRWKRLHCFVPDVVGLCCWQTPSSQDIPVCCQVICSVSHPANFVTMTKCPDIYRKMHGDILLHSMLADTISQEIELIIQWIYWFKPAAQSLSLPPLADRLITQTLMPENEAESLCHTCGPNWSLVFTTVSLPLCSGKPIFAISCCIVSLLGHLLMTRRRTNWQVCVSCQPCARASYNETA